MTWTDEAGGVHPSVGDTVTLEGIEHLYSCATCRNPPADRSARSRQQRSPMEEGEGGEPHGTT